MRKFKFHVIYSVWDFSKWNIYFFLGYNMITSILGTLMKKKKNIMEYHFQKIRFLQNVTEWNALSFIYSYIYMFIIFSVQGMQCILPR